VARLSFPRFALSVLCFEVFGLIQNCMIYALRRLLGLLYRVKRVVSYLLAFSAGYSVASLGVSLPLDFVQSFFSFLL